MEEQDFTIPEEHPAILTIPPIRESISEKYTLITAPKLTHHFSLIVPETTAHQNQISVKPKSTNILPLDSPLLEQKASKQIKVAYKHKATLEIKTQIATIKCVLSEIKSLNKILNSLYQYPQRKTILLDLDETIVFTVPLNKKGLNSYTCTPLTGKMSRYGVVKRPYLDIFLLMLSKHYDIMIYSAAERNYINMVIKTLNIGKFLNPMVFSREHCTILSNGMAIKNVQVLAKHVEDIILVDNSICSFFANPGNGIYIPSFNGNEKDNDLLRLGQFLLTLQDRGNLSNSLHDAGYDLDDILGLVYLKD